MGKVFLQGLLFLTAVEWEEWKDARKWNGDISRERALKRPLEREEVEDTVSVIRSAPAQKFEEATYKRWRRRGRPSP